MNIEFEAALKYIDLGNYDKAIEGINSAIARETEKGNLSDAAQFRCVLGELYANLGKVEDSTREFEQVLDYCDETSTLQQQRKIAQTYLDAFSGKLPMPAAPERMKRPGDVPLVPKPRQNAAFIAKQSRRHK